MVILSSGSISATGTEQGLNALPLMWQVHAWQTPMPQPYFGPVTPRRSRSTHSSADVVVDSRRVTRLPLRMKVCWSASDAPQSALSV